MPYKRSQKRRYRNNTPFHSYARGVVRKGPLQQLDRKVKFLQGLVNVEYKNHDVSQASTATDETGQIYALNYVNQGDGTESRDGSMFRMKSLEMRFVIASNTNMTDTSSVRVMVVLDADPIGSTPTLSTLLDNTTRPVVSPRNLDNRSQYIILYDRLFSLSSNGVERITRKIYKKIDYKVMFTGATASAANNKKNGLYLVFIADKASGATDKPNHYFDSRIRYIDN